MLFFPSWIQQKVSIYLKCVAVAKKGLGIFHIKVFDILGCMHECKIHLYSYAEEKLPSGGSYIHFVSFHCNITLMKQLRIVRWWPREDKRGKICALKEFTVTGQAKTCST